MQTFNEFFVRELKPGTRPVASMERDDVAICAADCRLMAFKSVEDGQRFWIKVFLLLAFKCFSSVTLNTPPPFIKTSYACVSEYVFQWNEYE